MRDNSQDTGRYSRQHNTRDKIRTEVTIAPSDKRRVEHFAQHEREFYNHLVDAFSSRIRNSPELLANITDREQELLLQIAKVNKPISEVIKYKKKDLLPKEYKQFENLIFKGDEVKMSEKKGFFMDLAISNFTLLPEVRMLMTKEFLDHYIFEASKVLRPASRQSEGVYQEPFKCVTGLTSEQKNHLQIPRKYLTLGWDGETKETLILCPYIEHPIRVKDVNLNEMFGWNYLVIRQMQAKHMNEKTPWEIDVFKTNRDYLLRYVDKTRLDRHSTFYTGQKRCANLF